MYQFEEIKETYKRATKRMARIVIGGITFMAAVISLPTSGMDTGQYNIELSSQVEKVIEKSRIVNHRVASQLFAAPALSDGKNALISKWDKELSELGEYEDDWDGDGAMAVNKDTIATAHAFMQETVHIIGKLSDIYPTPLGTICMEWRHIDATINVEIARGRIAFYCDRYSDGSDVTDYVKSDGITSALIQAFYSFFA